MSWDSVQCLQARWNGVRRILDIDFTVFFFPNIIIMSGQFSLIQLASHVIPDWWYNTQKSVITDEWLSMITSVWPFIQQKNKTCDLLAADFFSFLFSLIHFSLLFSFSFFHNRLYMINCRYFYINFGYHAYNFIYL